MFVSGGLSEALKVDLKWVIEKEGGEPLQDGENTNSSVARFVLAETVV